MAKDSLSCKCGDKIKLSVTDVFFGLDRYVLYRLYHNLRVCKCCNKIIIHISLVMVAAILWFFCRHVTFLCVYANPE